jgi:hypothetical protein
MIIHVYVILVTGGDTIGQWYWSKPVYTCCDWVRHLLIWPYAAISKLPTRTWQHVRLAKCSHDGNYCRNLFILLKNIAMPSCVHTFLVVCVDTYSKIADDQNYWTEKCLTRVDPYLCIPLPGETSCFHHTRSPVCHKVCTRNQVPLHLKRKFLKTAFLFIVTASWSDHLLRS